MHSRVCLDCRYYHVQLTTFLSLDSFAGPVFPLSEPLSLRIEVHLLPDASLCRDTERCMDTPIDVLGQSSLCTGAPGTLRPVDNDLGIDVSRTHSTPSGLSDTRYV